MPTPSAPIVVFGTLVPSAQQPIALATDLGGGTAQYANEAAIGAIDAQRLYIGQTAFSQFSGITYVYLSTTPAGAFGNGTWGIVSAPVGGEWAAAQLAATANVAMLSGEQTIDGVLTSGSRVLLAYQTTASQNGIYVTGLGAWTRASDAAASGDFVVGKTIVVTAGTANANTLWLYSGAASPTIGTTALTFGLNAASASVNLASPPPIGNVAPNSVAMTSLQGPSGGAGLLPMKFLGAIWTPGTGVGTTFQVETLGLQVTTTNATTTLLGGIVVATNQCFRIDVSYKTSLVAGGDCLANDHTFLVTNVAGAVTIVSTANGTALGTATGKAWPGLTAAVVLTSVNLSVTGAAAKTIVWNVSVDITFGD